MLSKNMESKEQQNIQKALDRPETQKLQLIGVMLPDYPDGSPRWTSPFYTKHTVKEFQRITHDLKHDHSKLTAKPESLSVEILKRKHSTLIIADCYFSFLVLKRFSKPQLLKSVIRN